VEQPVMNQTGTSVTMALLTGVFIEYPLISNRRGDAPGANGLSWPRHQAAAAELRRCRITSSGTPT
jgi:hypothetical protein